MRGAPVGHRPHAEGGRHLVQLPGMRRELRPRAACPCRRPAERGATLQAAPPLLAAPEGLAALWLHPATAAEAAALPVVLSSLVAANFPPAILSKSGQEVAAAVAAAPREGGAVIAAPDGGGVARIAVSLQLALALNARVGARLAVTGVPVRPGGEPYSRIS